MVRQSLSLGKKHAVVAEILKKQKVEALKMTYGSAPQVAIIFNISVQTVCRVWKQWVNQRRMGMLVPDLETKFHERGRKSKFTPVTKENIEEILQDYTNIHQFASEEQITANLYKWDMIQTEAIFTAIWPRWA
jgi:hypothetical protein